MRILIYTDYEGFFHKVIYLGWGTRCVTLNWVLDLLKLDICDTQSTWMIVLSKLDMQNHMLDFILCKI